MLLITSFAIFVSSIPNFISHSLLLEHCLILKPSRQEDLKVIGLFWIYLELPSAIMGHLNSKLTRKILYTGELKDKIIKGDWIYLWFGAILERKIPAFSVFTATLLQFYRK